METKTKILYWVFTILGPGAVFDALKHPEAIKSVTMLGYPEYIVAYVGVAKIIGIIAILIPGYPRIKEWAYAGIIFDLITAMYSQIIMGEAMWPMMLLFIGVAAASYIYSHKLQKEKDAATA
jgi:hypothetical protein